MGSERKIVVCLGFFFFVNCFELLARFVVYMCNILNTDCRLEVKCILRVKCRMQTVDLLSIYPVISIIEY